jgi:hypothetical protein
MLNVVLRVFSINTSYHVLLQEGLEMVEKAISTHLH